MFLADSYFQQKNYELARQEYLGFTNIGSAHAFYQLGIIHYKGLGVPANTVKGLVWFSLAAEQKFNDSEKIVADLLALAGKENKAELQSLISTFREEFGVNTIQKTYFPQLKLELLQAKIMFGDSSDISNQFSDVSDFEFEEFPDLFDEEASINYLLLGRPEAVDVRNRPYSAVVDYEIGKDGSVRNMESMQVIGYIKPALRELGDNKISSPYFGEKNVPFINRAYLGVAGFNKHKIRQSQYNIFYVKTKRKALKLKNSKLRSEQFEYAKLLMTFKWLAQDENELDNVLAALSTSGHPLAQYEYGLKLYREQKDITNAIHWLSEASKYGVAKAQYHLGRILLDSPWVENDESKALYWFEQAAASHNVAQLKMVELKLLAKDQRLHDLEGAKWQLLQIPEEQHQHPDFQYLQAIVNTQIKPRKLELAVDHLRKAINSADYLGWDVSEWEQLLSKWTSGGIVTIQD